MAEATVIDALYTGRRNSAKPLGIDQIQLGLEEPHVQLRVLRRFEAEGEHLGGWKVGLTSGKARDRMGKDFRPFGYVLQKRILSSEATVPSAKILTVTLSRNCASLSGHRYAEIRRSTEAKAAVRAVAPAFEINEVRCRPTLGRRYCWRMV